MKLIFFLFSSREYKWGMEKKYEKEIFIC